MSTRSIAGKAQEAQFAGEEGRNKDRISCANSVDKNESPPPVHGQSPAGPNETGGKAHPPKTKDLWGA